MQYGSIKSAIFAALAFSAAGCIHADSPTSERTPPYALHFTHVSDVGLDESQSTIQALILKGRNNRQRSTDMHGLLLMRPNRPLNKSVCAALVSNLVFVDARIPTAFSKPSLKLRYTEIYDSRTEEELSLITRPPFLSTSDCEELVSNFDFARSYGLLGSLRIDSQGHSGPWLLAVDPATRSILKFDLTAFQESELDDAMNQWTVALHDRSRWPRQEKTWKEIILALFGKKLPMEVISLPRDFQE